MKKQIFVLLQFISIGILLVFGNVLGLDLGGVFQMLAVLLGVWAIKSVGQNNWSVYPVPNEESSISQKGVYAYVRHPMYIAVLAFCWPIAIRTLATWAFAVAGTLTLTLVMKILFEEKQIVAKHPEYEAYAAKTKRLIPFIW